MLLHNLFRDIYFKKIEYRNILSTLRNMILAYPIYLLKKETDMSIERETDMCNIGDYFSRFTRLKKEKIIPYVAICFNYAYIEMRNEYIVSICRGESFDEYENYKTKMKIFRDMHKKICDKPSYNEGYVKACGIDNINKIHHEHTYKCSFDDSYYYLHESFSRIILNFLHMDFYIHVHNIKITRKLFSGEEITIVYEVELNRCEIVEDLKMSVLPYQLVNSRKIEKTEGLENLVNLTTLQLRPNYIEDTKGLENIYNLTDIKPHNMEK